MSLRDKQPAKKTTRTQVKKSHPDHAVHAVHQKELKELREELVRIEASDKSGEKFLNNAEIRGR